MQHVEEMKGAVACTVSGDKDAAKQKVMEVMDKKKEEIEEEAKNYISKEMMQKGSASAAQQS